VVQGRYLLLEVLMITDGSNAHHAIICISYHQYTCLLSVPLVYGVDWVMFVVCTFRAYGSS